MCGLTGALDLGTGGLVWEDVDAFNQLLIVGDLRGEHGAGAFGIKGDGKCSFLKSYGPSCNLRWHKNYGELTDTTKKPYLKILAGHNRYATTGKPSVKTSHPFNHKNITLMHNGTLTNRTKLPKKFEVDSEEICYALTEMSLADTVSNFAGAYAVVYYDSIKKTLNFARNYQRELFMAVHKTKESMFWASEPEFLLTVLRRKKLIKDYDIEKLPVETHWEIDVTKNTLDIMETQLPNTGCKVWTHSNTTNYHSSGQGKWLNEDGSFDFPGETPIGDDEIRVWSDEENRFVTRKKQVPPLPTPIIASVIGEINRPKPAHQAQQIGKTTTPAITGQVIVAHPFINIPEMPCINGSQVKIGDEIIITPYHYVIKDKKEGSQTLMSRCDLFPEEDHTVKAFAESASVAEAWLSPLCLRATVKEIKRAMKNSRPRYVIWVENVVIPKESRN